MRAVYVLSICLFSFSMAPAEVEATLKIGAKSYAAAELLKRPEIEIITVKHDPVYGGKEMQYQAIAAAVLFRSITTSKPGLATHPVWTGRLRFKPSA